MNTEIVVAPTIHAATKSLKWKHKYDRMVFLSLQGWSQTQIAEEVGCTSTHVSIILCSQAGKEHLALWEERLAERGLSTIEQGLVSLGRQSVQNIAETINADVPEKATRRKQHQDKISFELLARIGFGKKDKGREIDEGGLNGLPRELQERLVSALEQSAEATRINELPFADAEEIDDASD